MGFAESRGGIPGNILERIPSRIPNGNPWETSTVISKKNCRSFWENSWRNIRKTFCRNCWGNYWMCSWETSWYIFKNKCWGIFWRSISIFLCELKGKFLNYFHMKFWKFLEESRNTSCSNLRKYSFTNSLEWFLRSFLK